MTIKNDAELLANSHKLQVETFEKMCGAILAIYNKKAGKNLQLPAMADYYGRDTDKHPALFMLFDKCRHMAFDLYSPQSIPGFLRRIATKPIKVQAMPSGYKYEPAEKIYGKGHFRWDFKAHTLDENEIEALRHYFGLHVKAEAQKRSNKELAAAPKPDFEKITDYNEQAEAFLQWTGTKFIAEFKEHGKYFNDDKESRDIYHIALKNGRHRYKFTFGQSINGTDKIPTAYDVLACIEKNEVYDFEDFCSNFGYEQDSRAAYKTYKAVKKEWENINKLFTEEELELLREIN